MRNLTYRHWMLYHNFDYVRQPLTILLTQSYYWHFFLLYKYSVNSKFLGYKLKSLTKIMSMFIVYDTAKMVCTKVTRVKKGFVMSRTRSVTWQLRRSSSLHTICSSMYPKCRARKQHDRLEKKSYRFKFVFYTLKRCWGLLIFSICLWFHFI